MFQGVYSKKHGCFILTYRTLEDSYSENLIELDFFCFWRGDKKKQQPRRNQWLAGKKTPRKTSMEPQDEGLEDYFSFSKR